MRREVEPYRPHEVEAHWQQEWKRERLDHTPEPARKKRYVLEMFAYPSGDIHIGHFRNYTLGDVVARFDRMRGHDVLHPFGWDAFGLPAENAAITRGVHPASWTYKNIETSRGTLQKMGISYDWAREVITCRADYYKFTQWMFLLLHRRGLAYRAKAAVNWCPVDQTVLANEHVVNGCCWRHPDVPVEKRELEQWFFRITEYAERLLRDLDQLEAWPESTVKMQRSWIGRSEGAEVTFQVPGWATASGHGEGLTVFTTRPDTLWGATFLTLAPEHPMTERITTADRRAEVEAYVTQARRKTDIERSDLTRQKDGVFSGAYAINPVTHEPIPIWVADYVLGAYGTGAIMGVPAHDQRDFEFARTYGIPLKVVVQPADAPPLDATKMNEAFPGEGLMVHSPPFDGTPAPAVIPQVIAWLAERGVGRAKVQYRLRDWLISRQRYWGCPIPMIHCPSCGIVPVPEDQLPVMLPEHVESFIPTGRSPLEDVKEFIETTCPQCGGPARRDPDTMDTFVDSSWYHLRYVDPTNDSAPFSRERAKEWLPVDLYIGGSEHATGHLLYFRFFTKVLHDDGWLEIDEPVRRLVHHGMVMDAHGDIMSKSKGNVVSPGDLFARDGVDIPRLAMLFFAPTEAEILWNEQGIDGVRRFVHRLWETVVGTVGDPRYAAANGHIDPASLSEGAREAWRLAHRALERTTQAIDQDLAFNTAIAATMEWVNAVRKVGEPAEWSDADFPALAAAARLVAQWLAPLAPHLGEELWTRTGGTGSVFRSAWPTVDPAALRKETVEIPVQINGKLRSRVYLAPDAAKEEMEQAAMADEKVREILAGATPRRVIVVPGRLVNIVL